MDSTNDTVFGELKLDGSWVRDLEVSFLGVMSIVELIVEGNDDDESIFDEQRTAYQQLPDTIPKAENALFQFYQSICEDYRSRFGTNADARMPFVKEIGELSKLVRLTGIIFPIVLDPGEISVGFLLECSWDPEHGLGVKITNGEISVGAQDILT